MIEYTSIQQFHLVISENWCINSEEKIILNESTHY